MKRNNEVRERERERDVTVIVTAPHNKVIASGGTSHALADAGRFVSFTPEVGIRVKNEYIAVHAGIFRSSTKHDELVAS